MHSLGSRWKKCDSLARVALADALAWSRRRPPAGSGSQSLWPRWPRIGGCTETQTNGFQTLEWLYSIGFNVSKNYNSLYSVHVVTFKFLCCIGSWGQYLLLMDLREKSSHLITLIQLLPLALLRWIPAGRGRLSPAWLRIKCQEISDLSEHVLVCFS